MRKSLPYICNASCLFYYSVFSITQAGLSVRNKRVNNYTVYHPASNAILSRSVEFTQSQILALVFNSTILLLLLLVRVERKNTNAPRSLWLSFFYTLPIGTIARFCSIVLFISSQRHFFAMRWILDEHLKCSIQSLSLAYQFRARGFHNTTTTH